MNKEELITLFNGQTFSINNDSINWLRENINRLEIQIKQDFLKEILLEEKGQYDHFMPGYSYGWNDYRGKIINNARDKGIEI